MQTQRQVSLLVAQSLNQRLGSQGRRSRSLPRATRRAFRALHPRYGGLRKAAFMVPSWSRSNKTSFADAFFRRGLIQAFDVSQPDAACALPRLRPEEPKRHLAAR